ncbi:membrane protein [Nocardioides alpinus]|uniref:Membrane protein n=1 Tax=Nocardioides alpinus TaxID=748909 RepID=A0A1I1AW55_9ACTN|nr:hypothetical protein [Nocardioides alpinus]PKH40952.1 hypothetical protein CXG46_10870 [Nocardioides alpinus]SFB42329.1 membrane protein [Nocardioides alpinus]
MSRRGRGLAQAGRRPEPTGWLARQVAHRQAQADRLPWVRRLVAELTRIELVDRSLALGAQALLALLPFLVVLAAYAPQDFAGAVVDHVRETMGLASGDLRPAEELVDSPSIESNTGVFGFLVALVSATSFSRALQRMYARVFEVAKEDSTGRIQRSVVWLPVWLSYLLGVALLARWPDGLLGGNLWIPVLSVAMQVAFWWWSMHFMLSGVRSWGQLLPAALITTAASLLLFVGSGVVMPPYTRSSVAQFGSFGLILAAASWLVAFAGVLVLSSLIGRLVAESEAWRRVLDRVEDRRSQRSQVDPPHRD